MRNLLVGTAAAIVLAAAVFGGTTPAPSLPILPLKAIQPGMKGVGYTIFAGDRREKFDVEVLGILPNLMGPRQDIVLVRLSSPSIARSGVVAGMSGSPVYIDGKLAGAISLKFGSFTTEALAGMTPIEQILDIAKKSGSAAAHRNGSAYRSLAAEAAPQPVPTNGLLKPIETPLVFSGFSPQTLERFAPQWAQYGLVAVAGGTAPAAPTDAQLQPGDMASIVLLRGDLSVAAACTVTARMGNQVYLCGHPLLGFGHIAMPLARAHVVATLPSAMASTKIVNTGGLIGVAVEDRATGVLARLGAAPAMIPVTLQVVSDGVSRRFRFEVMENAKLTPLLVATAAFNGVHSDVNYDEGVTYRLEGRIELRGHNPVHIEEMFPPSTSPVPDVFPVAAEVQNIFSTIFNNPYEQPHIETVALRVSAAPQVRWASILNAWTDRREVRPGETVTLKVTLRPYRGRPTVVTIPMRIPEQVSSGPLRVLVSDGATLDALERQMARSPLNRLAGLDELIEVLNRQRRNDYLYVSLLQTGPTLLVEDKRLPNVPFSEINVLDPQRSTQTTLLWESEVGSRAVPVGEVVTGRQYLTLTVR